MIELPSSSDKVVQFQHTIHHFLTAGNTYEVKSVTLKLRQMVKAGDNLGSLFEVLRLAANRHTAQLTLVLISKIIKTEFGKLDEPSKQAVKELLVLRLSQLNDGQLERAIASLICKLLEVVPFNDWIALQQLIKGDIEKNNRRCLVVLTEILPKFEPPKELVQYVLQCVTVVELSELALNCLEVLMQSHKDKLPKDILERVLGGYDPNYHHDNENVKLMEILTQSARHNNKLDAKTASWVCKNVVLNLGLSARVRSCGIDFIFVASKNQEKLLSKKSFIKEIIQAACSACSESAGPPSKEDQMLKEVALWLIEARITKVHNKNAFEMLFQTVSSLINSGNTEEMCTGFTVLTGISQNCTEKLRLKLADPIMKDFIPRGLDHSEAKVRTAAINSLCYFCEFLYPDILDYYQLILTTLIKEVTGLGEDLTKTALTALDLICDKLQCEQLVDYLPSLVSVLVDIVGNPSTITLHRALALNALGCIVMTVELKFLPYLPQVMAVSLPLFQKPCLNADDKTAHAANITLQAKMLRQFCEDKSPIRHEYFQTYVMPNLEYIYTLLNQSAEEREIIESSFVYFYQIAEAIGSEFSVVFPRIVDRVFEVCEAEIDVNDQPTNQDDVLSLGEDSNDELLQIGDEFLKLSVAEMDMKSAALHTLGNIAEACPNLFAAYSERAEQVLEDLADFYFDNIREQVIACRGKLALGMVKMHFGGVIPPYKQGLPCLDRFPPVVEEYLQKKVIPNLMDTMMNDGSIEVRMAACDTIESLSKDLGPIVVEDSLPALCDAIRIILEQEMTAPAEEEPEQEPDDDEDHKELLIDSVAELIQRLSKVLRESFSYQLQLLMPTMMKHLSPEIDRIQNCIALVGCLAKCFKHIPSDLPKYHVETLQRFSQLFGVGHERLNRNISYCVGLMFEIGPAIMQPYFLQCRQMVMTIRAHSKTGGTIENAIAALCRMEMALNIYGNTEELLSMIMSCMPFTSDLHEIRTIYLYFMYVAANHLELIAHYLPQISMWLQEHLTNPKPYNIKGDIQEKLLQFHYSLTNK